MKNKSRESESLKVSISNSKNLQKNDSLILLSPSDEGVMRNGGRNGTRYAPKSLLAVLSKFNNHSFKSEQIKAITVTTSKKEQKDFNKAQKECSNTINSIIDDKNIKNIIHIGGGHDQILPLLMAIEKQQTTKNILIINIDAHCDTRIDDNRHSGTPFRNFSEISIKPTHLIQYGIQKQANSKTTLTNLENITSEHFNIIDLKKKTQNFSKVPEDILLSTPFEIDKDTKIVISLDCDAIDSSEMQAVSAVNGDGLPYNHVASLITYIKNIKQASKYFGIYEFNPVYDNINQAGARKISTLIYNYLGN